MLGVILYGHIKMIEGMNPRPADWCDKSLPDWLLRWLDATSAAGYQPVQQQEKDIQLEKITTDEPTNEKN